MLKWLYYFDWLGFQVRKIFVLYFVLFCFGMKSLFMKSLGCQGEVVVKVVFGCLGSDGKFCFFNGLGLSVVRVFSGGIVVSVGESVSGFFCFMDVVVFVVCLY